ncbi:MAG: hypothetical protein HQ490_09115 [Lutibacter sp.]|nr:hypothetical protein [Lutibacter sp.]
MNYLLYSSSSIAYPHFGVQLEEVENLIREGHRVTFAYCDGINNTCFKNMDSNMALCKACKLGYKYSLNKLPKEVELLPLKSNHNIKKHNFNYNNIEEIKKLSYREVSIGYGILSTFISFTRNPDLKLDDATIKYIDHLINQICNLTDAIYSLIDKVNPDAICVFNCRFFETKPLLDIAKSKKIDLICNEVVAHFKPNEPYRIEKYYNSMPHDIPNLKKKIINTWNISKLSKTEKVLIGESFYINKRNSEATGLINFTMNQKLGKLPLNWNIKKKNIVIFNSSEDEYAAIGNEFDRYALFNSQIEGIKFILSTIKSNEYQFYLRIHPNLSNIIADFHLDLLSLDDIYDNLTIIKAHEDISSNSLIDASWKVIVFGSTIGIESVYWGKPTILLAGALYHDLEALYKPKSEDELINLIKDELLPLDTLPAIKYGYFQMDREFGNFASKYVNLGLKHYSFLGFKFSQPNYMSFFESKLLMKLIYLFYSKLLIIFYKNKFPFPKTRITK